MESNMDTHRVSDVPTITLDTKRPNLSKLSKSSEYREDSSSEDLANLARRLNNGCYWLSTSNPKTLKGLQEGYITAVLSLAPAMESGWNMCFRYTHCVDDCLYRKGRGQMTRTQEARIRKTQLFMEDKDEAALQIHGEIRRMHRLCTKHSEAKLAVRLNCYSDLRWERMHFKSLGGKTLIDANPEVQFYDYTKYPYNYRPAWHDMPLNYHLTYSYDGTPEDLVHAKLILKKNHNVKIILKKNTWKLLKDTAWMGTLGIYGDHEVREILKEHLKITYPSYFNYPSLLGEVLSYSLTNSELTDNRFLDPSPTVCLGVEKGSTKIAL